MRSTLIAKIMQIQSEYREMLVKLKPVLRSDDYLLALDEIMVFWNKNLNIINIFLDNHISAHNTLIFTGSTFMDIDDNEHYPFLLLGEYHLFDDPLFLYAKSFNSMGKDCLSQSMYDQVWKTAEDNIKIIDNCLKKIIVLPFSLINQDGFEELRDVGNTVFLSFFTDYNNINELVNSLCTLSIDSIIPMLNDGLKSTIMMSDSDDVTKPFVERFFISKDEQEQILGHKQSDGEALFYMLYGYIQQATSIVLTCMSYKCTPYIRSRVVLHYVLLLLGNLSSDNDELMFHAFLANAIYQLCDKDRLAHAGLDRVLAERQHFEKSIRENVYREGNRIALSDVAPVIMKCFESLYDKLTQ